MKSLIRSAGREKLKHLEKWRQKLLTLSQCSAGLPSPSPPSLSLPSPSPSRSLQPHPTGDWCFPLLALTRVTVFLLLLLQWALWTVVEEKFASRSEIPLSSRWLKMASSTPSGALTWRDERTPCCWSSTLRTCRPNRCGRPGCTSANGHRAAVQHLNR